MASSNDEPTTSKTSLPTHKLSALARFTSFSKQTTKSPPIVFPPPSWGLDETLPQTPPPDSPNDTFSSSAREMIANLHLPGAYPSSSTSKENDDEGSIVQHRMDEYLTEMLSSEELNDPTESTDKSGSEGQKQGIWDMLAEYGRKGIDSLTSSNRATRVEEEEDSFMVYSPLEPDNDSVIEVADSESVLEYVDEKENTTVEDPPIVDSTVQPEKDNTSTQPPKKPAPKEKRAWVPSTTELSVLTTWWGYRLYLPPPVMEKLDATHIQATARAAMITTALKWMLDKLPLMLIPPQVRPVVALFKRLSPVIGYVGVFIAWGWKHIRSCDKGNGVVLTATWLLPTTLLPMAWDAGDIYGPHLAPKTPKVGEPDITPANKDGEKGDKKKSKLWPW